MILAIDMQLNPHRSWMLRKVASIYKLGRLLSVALPWPWSFNLGSQWTLYVHCTIYKLTYRVEIWTLNIPREGTGRLWIFQGRGRGS